MFFVGLMNICRRFQHGSQTAAQQWLILGMTGDLTTDADDASIVSAVVNMGKSLHMRVVAEWVETQEQWTFLKNQHCPEAQGFYFSEPMIAEEIARP